ncbi:MAG: hypothetical protein OEY56_02380 [Cyclobacteriaceae bacterium]|nr:hypothetical protein [Cyclobacteriaceae bacterium]
MRLIRLLFLFTLSGCYQAPLIENFDAVKWQIALTDCTDYRRIEAAPLLVAQKEAILSATQNQVTELLGAPDRHQLYDRNQKFFYYTLDCDGTKELSLRFDALGRVKEIQVVRAN